MITRQYIAWLAMVAIYDDANRAKEFDQILTIGNDVVGVKIIDDDICLIPEGTYNLEGWKEDFTFIPEPGQDSDQTVHPVWGEMHGNFLKCSEDIFKATFPLSQGKNLYIGGHSRGGSLSDGLASMYALHGFKVTGLAMFEAANIGKQKYVDWVRRQVLNGMIGFLDSTKNGPDPVVLQYLDSAPTYTRIELDAPPGGLEDLNPIRWHMSSAVYPGYLKIYPMP